MSIDLEQIKQDLNRIVDVQCSDGNWNYDPYMQGLANGLILAQAIVNDTEPQYLDAPEVFLSGTSIKDPQLIDGRLLPTIPKSNHPVTILSNLFKAEPDYAHSWHTNLAKSCYDAMAKVDGSDHDWAHEKSNEAATHFMKLVFGVETSANG